jgi:hypothetical protein
VSANSAVACNSEMAWLILTTRSRSQRSAAAPAIGPISSTGKKSANATMPSHRPDCVSCQVSQPMAIRCIHMPTSEIPLPAE